MDHHKTLAPAGDIIENDVFSSPELGHGIAAVESLMLLVEVKNTKTVRSSGRSIDRIIQGS
jgi:hypothetical protein